MTLIIATSHLLFAMTLIITTSHSLFAMTFVIASVAKQSTIDMFTLYVSAFSMYIVKMIIQFFSYIKNIAIEMPLPVKILCAVLFLLFLIQTIRLHRDHSILRSDAIKRSRSVIGGQVAEQLAPFLPGFPCHPGDARFIGKPVDFVAFPGLTEDDTVHEVLLIEVKTGKSALSGREKEIKRAVAEGRVRYIEYRADG